MLRTLILCRDNPADLAVTLASLVPAIPHGVIREGAVFDPSACGEIETIADAAGCPRMIAHGTVAEWVAREPDAWLLVIEAGIALEEGWWREAGSWLARSATARKPASAAFRFADPGYGLGARLREFGHALACLLPLTAANSGARIARAAQLALAEKGDGLAVRVKGHQVVLRARAFQPDTG